MCQPKSNLVSLNISFRSRGDSTCYIYYRHIRTFIIITGPSLDYCREDRLCLEGWGSRVFIVSGSRKGRGLCEAAASRDASRLLNIAFTSGYKEGGVALLRAVDGDYFFLVIFFFFFFQE